MTNNDANYAKLLNASGFAFQIAIEAAIRVAANNAAPKPFVWTKSADDILASVSRFCQRTSGSDH